MKRFIKILALIAGLTIVTPTYAYENEFETKALLETPQKDEITLALAEEKDTDNNEGDSDNDFYTQEDEELQDNINEDFQVFEHMGKNKNKDELTSLQKALKTKITRTDIPSFLLKEALTVDFQKGPISELQFFGGYRGNISSIFKPNNYSTKYSNSTTEIGVFGKTKIKNLDFKISFMPVHSKGNNYLEEFFGDAYIVSSAIPHHKVLLGRSRLQTGVEGGSSSYTLPFVARSQIARNFGAVRSTALKINGNYNYADYGISFGSSGRYLTSGLPGVEFSGWLNVKPFGTQDGKFGRLTVGGGLNAGHNRVDYAVGTAYIGYKHKKLWTNFEAAIADGYSGFNGISDKKATGWAYTLGWKFTPQLQLIGRIDQFDPDRDISHNLKREYTVGINYFIKGQALKLTLNYVYCQNQSMPDSHKIILATQVVL